MTAVFDENNRKTQETTDYGTFSLSHGYTYDAAGNKQTHTGPDSVTVTYHRDKGRLSRIELPNEGSIYYNSYHWSQPDKITWPGGSTRNISYTAELKPIRILDKDPGGNPSLDFQYTYEKTGNIKQKTTQDQTYDYDYDLLQRLTEAASQAETEGWEYDPNGNRTSDNLNPGSWHYDENDRLTQSPSATYTYDGAGHTTSKTESSITTHYIYNAEGRLNRIEDANQTVIAEYAYDPLGRRYKKATQTETLYFYYTDEGLAGEFNTTGSPIRQYGYVPDSSWTTNPLYQKTGQGYAYYQNDHLGTPQQLIRKNGGMVWKGDYQAFGELKNEMGTWDNKLGFPGQYYDQETGLYYNYFRDYDPRSGRYIQADPRGILLDFSAPERQLAAVLLGQTIPYLPNDNSVYHIANYAGQNPIVFIDPTGEFLPNLIVGGIIGLGSGLVNMAINSLNECVSPWDHFKAGFIGGFIGGLTMNPIVGGIIAGGITNGMNSSNSGGSPGDIAASSILGGAIGGFGGIIGGYVGSFSDPITTGVSVIASEAVGSAVTSGMGLGCNCN